MHPNTMPNIPIIKFDFLQCQMNTFGKIYMYSSKSPHCTEVEILKPESGIIIVAIHCFPIATTPCNV